MKRRNFLKISTAAGGGLLLSMSLPLGNVLASDVSAFDPTMFLRFDKDGSITYILTKFEMGQGSSTGLAQIIADELGANWETLKIEFVPFDKKFGGLQGNTGGSHSIRSMWVPLRQAGAVAREVLLQAAAKLCNDKKENFYSENGYVVHKTKGKKLPFKALLETAAKLPVPDTKGIRLKDAKDFKLIGKPVTHRRTHDVVQGKADYGINVKLPDMVHAAIERCPVYKGKLKSFDATEAKKIKGVKDVFAIKNVVAKDKGRAHVQDGVVVVANSTWTAFKARKALKIEWDFEGRDKNSMKALRQKAKTYHSTKDKPVYQDGAVDKAFAEADQTLEAVYENPFQIHAMMEPLSAVVDYKNNACKMWTGTQNVDATTQEVAHALSLPIEAVTVHVLPSGGSFGRRWNDDYVVEACVIAKKIKQPVKLTWSREDVTRHGAFHPFQQTVYKAALKDKKIAGWDLQAVQMDHWKSAGGLMKYDYIYQTPNIRTRNAQLDFIVETGAWRSVQAHSGSLGSESFMDELAHAAKADPLEFRLEHLNYEMPKGTGKRAQGLYNYMTYVQDKYIQTLKEVKKVADWGKKMPKGSAQGVAVTKFSRSVCAQVAEVTVRNGNLKIDKITCVLHCGRVINPHFVTGQMRGGVIWALTALKYGGIDIEKGVVQQDNFDTYKMLRMNEVPEIVVHLIQSDDPPVGAGEPGVPPLAPAVLNAIFAATGKRIRKIPVLPEDLV